MNKLFFGLITIFAFSICNAQQAVKPFVKGDRVVFVGNSITDGGHYHSYIWLYYMTHFPDRRIEVFNAGIGGDDASQINNRFNEDVIAKKPTVITLTFGMNDTKYFEFLKPDAEEIAKKSIQTTYENYLKIEKKMKTLPNVKMVMILSSPYDETVKFKNNYFPGKSEAMLQVAAFQEEAAKKNGWSVVDFNRPMTEINKREQAKDSLFSLNENDRIHPGNDGHLVMAYLFLKAQGLAGKKVAEVSINATQKKVVRQDNCTVNGLVLLNGAIRFNYLAKSLPYPIDTVTHGWGAVRKASDALSLIPFTNEFNQEIIRVSDLKSSTQYRLKIDGQIMGEWSGQQWNDGINLALINNTPQYQQALAIMHLNEERLDVEHRFRTYSYLEFNVLKPRGLLFKDDQASLDTLNHVAKTEGFVRGNMGNYQKGRFKAVRDGWQREMDAVIDQIYRINKPLVHAIEIKEL